MIAVVLSPEKKLFEGNVVSVLVPGEQGSFEILSNHAPIISSLVEGEIICKGDTEFRMKITGGFVEVSSNVISLCVESK